MYSLQTSTYNLVFYCTYLCTCVQNADVFLMQTVTVHNVSILIMFAGTVSQEIG